MSAAFANRNWISRTRARARDHQIPSGSSRSCLKKRCAECWLEGTMIGQIERQFLSATLLGYSFERFGD